MQGYCHSVETFGAVDGPGIRYVLFLAGCSLGCVFCHNPDTWGQGSNTVTVKDAFDDIRRYESFYRASQGGLTISGGEPLLQADFTAALAQACRGTGINVLVDTSGYCPTESIDKVGPYIDGALFSLKAANPDKHRCLTLAGNELILSNLRRLSALTDVTVRYAVIPEINDTEQDIIALAGIIKTLPRRTPVELLPYHAMGRAKWLDLGRNYRLDGVRPARTGDLVRAGAILDGMGIDVLPFDIQQ